MNKEVTKVDKCPITEDDMRFTYLDLGEMPLVNNLTNTLEESFNCKKYNLSVQYFEKSKLSCLTENVNPDLMFSQYSYKSGVVKAYATHCKEMLSFVNHYTMLKESDNVLDIGGNDGTLLKTFLEDVPYLNVLNVDASENLTKLSNKNGIPAINAYWGIETAKKLDKKFKLITSTNVFQHTPPIVDYVEAISMSLDKFGIWCLEFPYWKTNMETNQYDQIYHEHVYYYLLQPLKVLLERFGLRMIHVLKYPIHGGTLRLLISHTGELAKAWQPSESVDMFLNAEAELDMDYYKAWGTKISNHILSCKEFLVSLKKENKNIVGFGAAAKGCIFLNSAKIDNTIIDCVIDDTDLKQEKYIPGTGIQIHSRDYLKNNKVDYILILAHNFKDVIIETLKNDYKGKFIVLFPNPEII
jgi:hypothetical protein